MAELQPTMPVIPGMAGYPSTTNGLGGIGLVGLIGMNSLFGNGMYGNNIAPASNILEQTLGHIRKDISDAALESCKVESRVQAAIQVQDTNNQVNFRSLDTKICETEKSAIVYAKDAIIESLKTEARITDRITAFERNADMQFCDVKKNIEGVNTNLEKVNTHLTHLMDQQTCKLEFQAERNKSDLSLQVERGFCQSREEILKDELAELRRSKDMLSQNLLFSNQLTAINSAIADLSQNQKLTNQSIQFGTGNVSTPTATNNQVR